MARPLRLERPGALYHIATLGNAGLPVFRTPEDSQRFLDLAAEAFRRFAWRCLAYCLLPDRYILLVVTEEATLSRGMRQINGCYTQDFHRRYGTAGHLFQGRYRAVMAEEQGYLAPLACDVLRQPVARGLVSEAAAWRWSSFRATVSRGHRGRDCPPWLDRDRLLAAFAGDPQAARARLAESVARPPATPVWEDLRHQVFLGSEAFVSAMREAGRAAAAGRGRLSEIPRAQWQPPPPSLESFSAGADSRDAAMARAYLSGAYSQAAIAAHFGVHYSTVSRAVRRHEQAGVEAAGVEEDRAED